MGGAVFGAFAWVQFSLCLGGRHSGFLPQSMSIGDIHVCMNVFAFIVSVMDPKATGMGS